MTAAQIAAFATRTQTALVAAYPSTVTIAGATLDCATRGPTTTQELAGDGSGLVLASELALHILRTAFATASISIPAIETTITWNSTTWRITSVEDKVSSSVIRITARPISAQ